MKKTADFLKENLPFIKIRKNHAIITSKAQEYHVPSNTYPVANKPTLRFFSYADTEQLDRDSKLAQLYDQLEFKVGFCYQNTENFAELLRKHNMNHFKTYTGWIVNGGLPVHHCWMVWKDKHVIDPGISLVDNLYLIEAQKRQMEYGDKPVPMDEMRQLFIQIHKEHEHKANSEIRTFGQVAPFTFYIGTETTPMQGRKIFNELMDKMPNHPSYANSGMNGRGESTLQKMLREQS